MKPSFLEIESLTMKTPSASELRKGVKKKCTGKKIVSIQVEMIVSFTPGSDVELENTLYPTTEVLMMDDTYHIVPVPYEEFKEKIKGN